MMVGLNLACFLTGVGFHGGIACKIRRSLYLIVFASGMYLVLACISLAQVGSYLH